MHCGYFDTSRKGNHSSSLTPAVVGGRRHIRLNFALKVIQPFKTRRLRQISAYNISAVRDSKNSSIMTNIMSTSGLPKSYRWNSYVTHKSPRSGSKAIFLFFKIILFNFRRIKSATTFPCVKTSSG